MRQRIEGHDWTANPLGERADWPLNLKLAVDIILGSGHAICLAWGPERILLYNDSYAPFLGARHPDALGKPFAEVWSEIWDDIGPLVDRVFEGETTTMEDMPLQMTRNGYPEETWWTFSYSPVRDETGAVTGLLNIASESTPRVVARQQRDQAIAELQESEAFMSGVLAASTDCIKVLDLDGQLTFMSEGGQRVMEVSDFNAVAGCPWPDFWQDAGNAEAKAAVEAARLGNARTFIGKADTFKGKPKWWHVAVSPIAGPDGAPARILSVSRDITELRASEAERDRFVRLAENSSDFVSMALTDGQMFYLNAAARALVGLADRDVASLKVVDFFPPADAERMVTEVMPAIQRDGHWAGEVHLRHFQTGELIPVLQSMFTLTDAEGAPIGYGTVTRDFRERRRAEDDMQMMNGELAHRLKNVLAVVQAIASQTLRGVPEAREASHNLSARLVALGAATDVLTSGSWRSADLREVATRALSVHGTIGERILLSGPPVMLKPEVTVAFALALHELGTNAVKYGALSNEHGTVRLSWTIDGEGDDARLSISWREQDGPPVTPPERTGFGSMLIERSLRSYFSGKAATEYRPDGLVFELEARFDDAAVRTGK